MKITRDFTHGAFVGKAGESISTEDQAALGTDALRHLKEVAGVIEGNIPDGLAAGGGATVSGAITADQAEADGTLITNIGADMATGTQPTTAASKRKGTKARTGSKSTGTAGGTSGTTGGAAGTGAGAATS